MKKTEENLIKKMEAEESVAARNVKKKETPFIFEEDKDLIDRLSGQNRYIGRALNH